MNSFPFRLVLAAALALPSIGNAAARRVTERAPSPSRAAAVAAAPSLEDLARSFERLRLESAFGDDWDEALVETVDGDVESVLRKHGGSWRAHGLGKDAIKAPLRRRAVEWYLEVSADPAVRRIEPNPRAMHPGCRQMSVDILQSGTQLVPDLVTQPALRLASAESLDASGIVVGIVDSGVARLPGLEERLLPAINALHPHGPVIEDDPSDLAEHAGDANGHGTAMATLVATVAGGATLLPVRVVGADCEGTAFDLAAGLTAAADGGARVVLVSLSTTRDSPLLRRTVAELVGRGVLIVAAAGNARAVEYPAAYPGVLSVTAVDADGWPPAFAPVGSAVSMAAPGVDVVAVGPDGALSLTGTSPAAALVAGAAARVASVLAEPNGVALP